MSGGRSPSASPPGAAGPAVNERRSHRARSTARARGCPPPVPGTRKQGRARTKHEAVGDAGPAGEAPGLPPPPPPQGRAAGSTRPRRQRRTLPEIRPAPDRALPHRAGTPPSPAGAPRGVTSPLSIAWRVPVGGHNSFHPGTVGLRARRWGRPRRRDTRSPGETDGGRRGPGRGSARVGGGVGRHRPAGATGGGPRGAGPRCGRGGGTGSPRCLPPPPPPPPPAGMWPRGLGAEGKRYAGPPGGRAEASRTPSPGPPRPTAGGPRSAAPVGLGHMAGPEVQPGRTAHRYLSIVLCFPPAKGVRGPVAVNGTGQGELVPCHKTPRRKGPHLGSSWATFDKDVLVRVGALCRGYL
ncbi:collagen alpha-1(I) chain-like [Harpia harpyja]|uniref:collagen alpha-1(I) chain-like n=1 Tax=Harpia harpyja TaxID=202280 RepID=UPI0022B08675|nr:collagen alpha-1(I) chain-like [Harpia harpyja]